MAGEAKKKYERTKPHVNIGTIGHVDHGKKPKNKIEFYANNTNFEVRFDPKQFNAEKYEIGHDKNGPIPFDYAYCITCHRSQGSEYNKVMVLEQKCQAWSHIRWAYTAASRAKESVIWVEGY